MANQKSTTIIALGVAVFVIGGALLFLVVHNNNNSNKKSPKAAASQPTTSTTVAGAVSAGTTAFTIPAGENALTVQMDYFGGGAGFVKSGDVVNIYAVANKGCAAPYPQVVKLVQSNVRILDVLGSPPAQTGQPGSFVLSVTPQQAEVLIYQVKFAALYFTLTTGKEAPANTTGVTCTNAL